MRCPALVVVNDSQRSQTIHIWKEKRRNWDCYCHHWYYSRLYFCVFSWHSFLYSSRFICLNRRCFNSYNATIVIRKIYIMLKVNKRELIYHLSFVTTIKFISIFFKIASTFLKILIVPHLFYDHTRHSTTRDKPTVSSHFTSTITTVTKASWSVQQDYHPLWATGATTEIRD